ncbi:hypothetical protein D9M68_348090 [compost metagenome]
MEVGAEQVCRAIVERVEEGTGERSENGVPAEQAEQRIEQGVLHVVHGRAVFVEMQQHGVLHREWFGRLRQDQVDALYRGLAGRRLLGQAQLASQARQDTAEVLLFLFAFGLCAGALRQLEGLSVGVQSLQYADAPYPRARVIAQAVQTQGSFQQIAAFAVLADLEQQLAPTCIQPGIRVGLQRQFGEQPVQRFAGIEALPPAVQVQVVVEVGALAEASCRSVDLHFFVLVDAEVGEDEFGPVLVEIAEEHQAQAVADIHQAERVHAVAAGRVPGSEVTGFAVFAHQGFQPLRLASRCLAEAGIHFAKGEQAEELGQFEFRRVIHPAQGHQRFCRSRGIAYFRVVQLAGAK